LAHAQRRLADATKSVDRILTAIEHGGELDSLLKRLAVLEREKANLAENVEQLDRKVRSTQAIGSGETELGEMKSLLDVNLSDNVLRVRLGQAIRRVVTRIDLSFTPTPRSKGVTIQALFEGAGTFVTDPCPPKKTRKPLYFVVHFRHGGKRAIIRFPDEALAKLKRSDTLFTGRV
ncbi:MAG: hypothetical protein ABIY63_18745, partial [Fibrobacteria bacterium]